MTMSQDDRFWAATRKGLFEVRREAPGRWDIARVSFLGDNVSMLLPADGTLYAALDHGHFGVKLHRSADGGASFAECAPPKFPEKPAGVEDLDPFKHTPIPWTVLRVWSLEVGEDADVLYCGTIPGGLFRSGNGGRSWELVRSLWEHEGRRHWSGGGADYPGIHSICINPQDRKQVSVAVSLGGVWLSEDAGATWACGGLGMWAAYMPPERKFDPYIQDPHRMVQCAARPAYLWVQHHNAVFRSADGGRSFEEVPAAVPSTFGFAVAVHPRDPQTAWLLPAQKDELRVPVSGQVVVARTRDGGASFEVLRRGLPQRHAYDIVYRHALDIDHSGERLAFGSTTGSLWVTEDQGESWHTVSEHLPPIYAVRFPAY